MSPLPPFFVMPLDGRPVCYAQVQDLAAIANLPLILPPLEMMGVLKKPAPLEALFAWWKTTLAQYPQAMMILSLDTLAYGGLIASRVNTDNLDVLDNRLKQFLGILGSGNRPRYAFTSILRIPDADYADEEPEYWAEYGKLLYKFSVETHQQGSMPRYLFNKIPKAFLQDFLDRREKNFNLNKVLFAMLEKGTFDFLVFSQDDTGPQGLNVREAEYFQNVMKTKQMQFQTHVQTGADEVALTLLVRALWSKAAKPLKVFPFILPDHGKRIMARFDGMPIGNIVQRQIQTLGAVSCLSAQDADLILLVNAPHDQMGDHCIQEGAQRPANQVQQFIETLQKWLPQKPVAIADIVYANGADTPTVEAMLAAKIPLHQLAGYAAWNTPGNTIGTALAMGGVVAWACEQGCLNETAQKKLLLKRFLDDWYYQSEVRHKLRKRFQGKLPGLLDLELEMQEGLQKLLPLFDLPEVKPAFSFPCDRLFEIAVQL